MLLDLLMLKWVLHGMVILIVVFFDENGSYIEGYYIVGLLAEAFLQKNLINLLFMTHDLLGIPLRLLKKLKGRPVMSKTGHPFMKEKMREEDAVMGGDECTSLFP